MRDVHSVWSYRPSEALPVDTGGIGHVVALEPLEAARDLGVRAVVHVGGDL